MSVATEQSSPEMPLQNKIQLKANLFEAPRPKPPGRATNPHAHAASETPSIIGGISTKQRLAQAALAPALPKDITPLVQHKSQPHPIRPSGSSLMNLNFKKNTLPTLGPGLRSPMTNNPTLASLNSPTVQSPQMLTDAFPSVSKQTTAPSVLESQYHENQSFTQPDSAYAPDLSHRYLIID